MMRAAVFCLSVLLSFAPAAAQTLPSNFTISYAARVRGIESGRVDYGFTLQDGAYRATSQRRLSGMARMFLGASQDFDYAAQGRVDQAVLVHPTSYQHRDYGRRHRLVRVSFDGDSVTTIATPPMGMGHPAATPEQKANAIDQVSLLLQMLIAAGDPCQHRYRVFMDGRSRFDLVLTPNGQQRVAFPGYQGNAMRCSVAFQPIAGFSDPQQPARLTFLFARVNNYTVPVSIEMPTDAVGIVELQVRSFQIAW